MNIVDVSRLMSICHRNNLADLKEYLEENEYDKEKVEKLMQQQLNGRTPLFIASLSADNNIEFIKFLLESGSRLDQLSPNQLSVLNAAYSSSKPNEEVIKHLIENASTDTLNNIDVRGNNLLHYAVDNEQIFLPLLEILLEKGIDPNKRNNLGYSPIFKSSVRNRFDFVKTMTKYNGDLNSMNNNNNTILMYACMYNQLDAIKYLVEQGVDVNYPDNQGDTAILYSCGCDNHSDQLDVECIKYLVDAGAKIDHISEDGFTALMYAVNCMKRAHFKIGADIIKYLIDIGVDATLESKSKQTYLDYLLSEQNIDEVIFTLIKDKYIRLDDPCFIKSALMNGTSVFRQMILKFNRFTIKKPPSGECSICNVDFNSKDVYIECDFQHCYHEFCLLHWFNKCQTDKCPFCQLEIDIIKGLYQVETQLFDKAVQTDEIED